MVFFYFPQDYEKNRITLGVRLVKRIENTDVGFLDTNFLFAQVLLENRNVKKTTSFMMFCLISIVIFINAY